MSTTPKLTIVDGDGKLELQAQLSDIGRVQPQRPTFSLTALHPNLKRFDLKVHIDGAIADDGSGNHWIITGFTPQGGLPTGMLFEELEEDLRRFVGFYDSRRREGWIQKGSLRMM